ncbi:MAG: M28 family metallopeptidase [Bacteroidales bacterium]|nr:M28 family metallopeptidase [Bacteroidales bacterium]
MEKILEIQRRFFRKEKNQFLDRIEEELAEYGYKSERKDLGMFVKSINLETKCDKPEFIFIAHYDTGGVIPFWFHPFCRLLGTNSIASFVAIIVIFFTLDLISSYWHVASYLRLILGISFLSILIPNKKNFDDNTSGVVALLKLAKKFKEKGMNHAKFIFVDNEEWGLFGSRAHKKYLEKEQNMTPQCKIISIDCVGGGGKIPIITRNGKSEYAKYFQKEIQKQFELCKSVRMALPFSDNYSFSEYGALNISFANRAILPVGYYIPRIHSSKDREINLPQIEKLTDVLTDAIKNLLQPLS